ncbi:SLOG family protein [Pseudomonas delhiensis]|uniref:SLOG family protein n=1 Tax=Pseudomonas delhiensis TaxID=366289 RepID=UPI003CC90DBE
MTVRIVVCGGRDYADHNHVRVVLEHVQDRRGIDAIIQTGGWGAEHWARYWAKGRRCEVITAQNVLDMFDLQPDGVIAFPGRTRTAATLAAARRAGIPVYHAPPPGTLPDMYRLTPIQR